MAIPPTMFPTVAESLASVGLNERGRIVVEKPFGRDLASAIELNATLHTVFPEERIFRIDHYLGKESVEDLLVFRFSNTLLEPVWNRNYVRSVQITMSETIGVEGRGSFYDGVGTIRDVMQNHLLQVPRWLRWSRRSARTRATCRTRRPRSSRRCDRSTRRSWCAASTSATATSQASPPIRRSRRSSPPDSRSTRGDGPACRGTCAAARRCGPRQPRSSSSSTSHRACCSTRPAGRHPQRNLVRFRLGRHDGVTFTLQAKTPGPHLDSQNVDVAVDFAAALGERREAYERLLDDAIAGFPAASPARTSSSRRGESCSRRSTTPGAVHPYFRGEWGPAQADRILDGDSWFTPS